MNQMPTVEEVMDFVRSLFGHRSKKGDPVTFDTPCKDLFHEDIDGVDLCIGGPIQEKYDLNLFGFQYGLAGHSYRNLGPHHEEFYRQFPKEAIGKPEFTLRRFAEMVHRLVEIRQEVA